MAARPGLTVIRGLHFTSSTVPAKGVMMRLGWAIPPTLPSPRHLPPPFLNTNPIKRFANTGVEHFWNRSKRWFFNLFSFTLAWKLKTAEPWSTKKDLQHQTVPCFAAGLQLWSLSPFHHISRKDFCKGTKRGEMWHLRSEEYILCLYILDHIIVVQFPPHWCDL